jgi:glycosyltransferase involved in cell wall biosynthesis
MQAHNQEHSNVKPKVTVTVVTYNHGDWLAQCLESIVTQQTDFPFEVIVGDDASTDGRTVEVLKEYAAKYPDIVVPVLRSKNIGPTANYFDVIKRARGGYISHVDGDDGMLPGKLQIQKNFMDLNDDCVMSGHQMKCMDKNGQAAGYFSKKHKLKFDANYLLANHAVFAHSSIMYRANCREKFNFNGVERVDLYIYLLIAGKNKIAYLHESLGFYRRGVGIASQNWTAVLQDDVIDLAKSLEMSESSIDTYRAKLKLSEAYSAYKNQDYKKYLKTSTDSIKIKLFTVMQPVFLIHSLLMRISEKLATHKNRW